MHHITLERTICPSALPGNGTYQVHDTAAVTSVLHSYLTYSYKIYATFAVHFFCNNQDNLGNCNSSSSSRKRRWRNSKNQKREGRKRSLAAS